MMSAYSKRSGRKMTYESLAKATGISVAALQSLGSRPSYNATLGTIEKICLACECLPGDLLELDDKHAEMPPCP